METIFHALVGCKAAKKIWKSTRFAEVLKGSSDQDILSFLLVLNAKKSKADLEHMVGILWMIWNARNSWLFKGKKDTPEILVSKAEAVMEAYQRTQKPAAAHIGNQQRLIRKAWNPPQRGCFKVNVDAATNSEKQLSGLGAVIRDENGNVIAAAIKVSRFYGEAAYAEAEAIDWGLQIADQASLSSLVVESDAQEVVQLVNNNQGCRSEIYWIISEVQSLLKNFDSISVQYTHRSCNVLAHSLPKLALERLKTIVWIGSFPPHLLYLFFSVK